MKSLPTDLAAATLADAARQILLALDGHPNHPLDWSREYLERALAAYKNSQKEGSRE